MLDITLAERLSKLIKMLTSTHDGEVVAAARAIQRNLGEAGLDIHTLAKVVVNGGPPVDYRAAYREGYSDGLAKGSARNEDAETEEWQRIVSAIARHQDRLREHEREFVSKMEIWIARGRLPSEKQGKWLDYLFSKFGK